MARAFLRGLGSRFLSEVFGYGIGGAITPAIEPFVRDATHTANRERPNQLLSPADLASMVVQGVRELDDAADEALQWGVSRTRFEELVATAGAPIAPEQALELWNRGQLDEEHVDRAIRQSRLKPEWLDTFKLLRRAVLQAADLASMVVQGVLEEQEGRRRAAMLGLEPADFDRLVRLAGNPPGPQTVLSLWQRGTLDEQQVDRALLQSRLKPEWVEPYKALAVDLPTAAQLVNAVVRQRIPYAEGQAKAAQVGVEADTFRLLVESAGRPIGIMQALTLYNRGVYTRADVEDVVARSNVRTEYTDAILHLAVRYPSLFQMKQLVQSGAVDDAYATRLLREQGYPEQLAAGVIAAAHGDKLKDAKELTRAQVVELYQERAIARAEATAMLRGLGYDAHETDLLLGLADTQLADRYRKAVIAVVRARFLQRDIDVSQATSLLDQAGIRSEEREQLLDLWQFDVEANPRLLTLAQLNSAAKKGVISAEQYRAYLPRLGYVEPELSILAQLYGQL